MFAHLHCHTEYSFLDGGSTVEELVRRAAQLGMPALAMTDHNNVAAAVKFTSACRQYHVKPILGAEVTMADDTHLTFLARSSVGYANLCRLISRAYVHGDRLDPHLPWHDLQYFSEGLICLSGCRRGKIPKLIREHKFQDALEVAKGLREIYGAGSFFLELQLDATPDAEIACHTLKQLGERLNVGVVATNNVHYATPSGMIAHDVLRCIHAGITKADIHPDRPLNCQRYLKSHAEMTQLFEWCLAAISNSHLIAEQCEDVLPSGSEITPQFPIPDGHTTGSFLRQVTYAGARERYKKLTSQIAARLDHELNVITELGYGDLFLHAWKLVQWTRSQGIYTTGRGSAADSCVAYCLRLTDVDVIQRNLPFARFLCPGRTPDIDLDFDRLRRDEVFEYLKREYGQENVAVCCTFHTFKARSAVRDVGKVMGLPAEVLEWFSDHLNGYSSADALEEAFNTKAELRDYAGVADKFAEIFDLCGRIAGYPRHLGSHSSGVIIGKVPLNTLAPVSPSARGVMPIMMLDKDDIEEIGLIKIDVLSLPFLTALNDAQTNIRQISDPKFDIEKVPWDDQAAYKLIQAGLTMALFQVASPAQMALALSTLPSCFEDLVIALALIRPGPITSASARKYVEAFNGWARITVLHHSLGPILEKTLGCLVFQEQLIQVIAAILGISDIEADKYRKKLGKWDKQGVLDKIRQSFVRRARKTHPDLPESNADLIFDELSGWLGYGFIEGHSASFARTAYLSAYLKANHTAALLAAVMSNQPIGFYNNNSLAADGRRFGLTILPVDINQSQAKCFAPDEHAIRLGLQLVVLLSDEDVLAILEAREERPFESLLDFAVRVPMGYDRLESLVLAGAFDALHYYHRRGLVWRLQETAALAAAIRAEAAQNSHGRLGVNFGSESTPVAWELEDFSDWDKLMWEWRRTGICASCHPFAHLRDRLTNERVMTCHEALQQPQGKYVRVAGMNIRPHRPPTKTGQPVLYTTLEDETNYINASCSQKALERNIATLLLAPAVIVHGRIQHKVRGRAIIIEHAQPMSASPMAEKQAQEARECVTA